MDERSGDAVNGGGSMRAKLLGMPRPEDSPLYELVQERLRSSDPAVQACLRGLPPADRERLANLDPVDWVLARRREGMSWDKIALKLYNDTGRQRMINAETLRNWAFDLEGDDA